MKAFERVVRVALYFQTAIFLFKGFAFGLGLANVPGVGEGGPLSRRLGTVDVARGDHSVIPPLVFETTFTLLYGAFTLQLAKAPR